MTSWFSQRECKITYSAVSYTGYYGVAAMIEDFAKPTDTEALSSIPLQFLVYVFNSNEACNERPDFTEETRPKGSCIGIPPGGTYFDRIIVRAGGPSKRWRKDLVMCCCSCCFVCGYSLPLPCGRFTEKINPTIKNSRYTDFERGEIRFFYFFFYLLLSRFCYTHCSSMFFFCIFLNLKSFFAH